MIEELYYNFAAELGLKVGQDREYKKILDKTIEHEEKLKKLLGKKADDLLREKEDDDLSLIARSSLLYFREGFRYAL